MERLIQANIAAIEQMCSVFERLNDDLWTRPVNGLRVGPHVRHVFEFYECFLDGVARGQVDYDSRRRNAAVENSRVAGISALRSLTPALEALSRVGSEVRVWVVDQDLLLGSTVGRELNSLLHHTIHHMALIAIALQAFGVIVEPLFGVAPATIRCRQQTPAAA